MNEDSSTPTQSVAPAEPLPNGWVYFLRGGDFIKIGFSRNPSRRVNHFVTGNPFALKLLGKVPGTQADERALHQAFAAIRSKREWFHAKPELVAVVRWLTRFAGDQPAAPVEAGNTTRALADQNYVLRARVAELEAELGQRHSPLGLSAHMEHCRLSWLLQESYEATGAADTAIAGLVRAIADIVSDGACVEPVDERLRALNAALKRTSDAVLWLDQNPGTYPAGWSAETA